MKIGAILTKDESRKIQDNISMKRIEDIPQYDSNTGAYQMNGIEYPTEDEAYEAIDEIEL